MKYSLRNHQLDFKNFFFNNGYLGALAWHGMGLGKTLTSLDGIHAHLSWLKKKGVRLPKALVLMPKSAHSTWQQECHKFTPYLYRDLLLLPYSQIHKALQLAKYHDIRMIVMDESHYIKNVSTSRAQNLSDLLKSIHHGPNGGFEHGRMLLLSGTPMLNGAFEWYSSWALCASQSLLGSAERLVDKKRYETWKNTFAQAKQVTWKTRRGKGFGVKHEGIANEDKLTELLAPIVHYRRVEDCVDLPAKQIIPIDLNLPDDKLLKDANIEEPEAYMALVERLARAKTPHMIDWIRDYLKTYPMQQLVVFSQYRFPIDEASEKFKSKSVRVTGAESSGERKANIKAFQDGKKQICFLTYAAGSEALNFQNCFVGLYLGYPWTDGKLKQAMARIYRSGQANKTLHYFLTSGENDIRILSKVRAKEEATNTVEDNLLAAQGIKKPELTLDTFI